MKNIRLLSLLLAVVMLFSLSACSKFDSDYGKSDNESENKYANVKVPDIKSDDEVMPTFFDISLYDEENYSQIYLGKKYEYNFIYSGTELELPIKLSKLIDNGFSFIEGSNYNESTNIKAGKSLKVEMTDSFGKHLVVQFYNPSKSSVELSDAKIVKYIVSENNYLVSDSHFGQFFINGVSNDSAITDVIEYLGAPSHFYAVNENCYYLDYFLSSRDKRSKIRVYIDIDNDCVTSVEISKF
ncbi:MAG: hypothetical protein IKF53_03435 [Clostridia bacterium]|nr:hypothetical protein [Clostridia bacterium]